MKKLLVFLLLIIVFSGAGGIFYLRSHGLSARAKPNAVEDFLARHVRDLATTSRVKDLKNPIPLSELVLAEARDHFANHCAQCHGNDGDGKTMLGNGMYPPPPNLAANETQNLTDGELFNIIQNGIRFTGMPGFGGEDEENWELVHFIRHIPKLTPAEKKLMKDVNKMEYSHDAN